MSMSGHQSPVSGTDEWLTPLSILGQLGPFDLDPCATVLAPWLTAKRCFTIEDDGLAQEWTGRVWCNPPFGRKAVQWLRRLADHGDGIALIPARTETAMFYETVWGRADSALFIQGRPHFCYPSGKAAPFNSDAPICLVAYGHANTKALVKSKQLGLVVPAHGIFGG